MVVALGADLDPAATPGLIQGGHEFYTLAGAFAARDVLAGFGGGRVIVGVTSTPFKCPPAPSETALMMHDYLTERGLVEGSEVSLVMPFGVPVPPSPAASAALLAAFAERGINWHADRSVRALDPARKVAVLDNQEELPYDLFLGVPVHRAPAVVLESELCVDGWIPVNPLTLETTFPNVYAVGDVTSVGTPKAGVFAEGQAVVVADEIVAQHRGRQASGTYDGRGHLLRRVRPPSGRSRRRDVPERRTALRRVRWAVSGLRSRQVEVRVEPHPALVRTGLDQLLTECEGFHRAIRGVARALP